MMKTIITIYTFAQWLSFLYISSSQKNKRKEKKERKKNHKEMVWREWTIYVNFIFAFIILYISSQLPSHFLLHILVTDIYVIETYEWLFVTIMFNWKFLPQDFDSYLWNKQHNLCGTRNLNLLVQEQNTWYDIGFPLLWRNHIPDLSWNSMTLGQLVGFLMKEN